MKDIIIAIDGYSACGKSTLAKLLSKEIGYAYIDTGAMYRAVTLYFLDHEIDFENEQAVAEALAEINIQFKNEEGANITYLNGKRVEEDIRSMRVSGKVSEVAALSSVRRKMVEQQQQMGKTKSVILDGRDIGTVVFPEAEVKLFLTASPEERAKRRYEELLQKGQETPLEEVLANLQHRDHIDSSRADSPLKQAEDAVVIDNTNLNLEEEVAMVKALIEMRRA
ncbi:MAG: (d)CMP kinase [Bacteroidota bacterium]